MVIAQPFDQNTSVSFTMMIFNHTDNHTETILSVFQLCWSILNLHVGVLNGLYFDVLELSPLIS